MDRKDNRFEWRHWFPDRPTRTAWIESLPDEAIDYFSSHEWRDCTVRALTTVTGLPYRDVWLALAKAGRDWRRGTYTCVVEDAAKALGFEVREVRAKKAKTWITVPREFPKGKFYIRKRGHAAGMVDGHINDFGKGRKFRLWDIYKVTPRWNGSGYQMNLFGLEAA